MSSYCNTIRTTGTMAIISLVLSASAQVPLVPEWEHTWTYGQDPLAGLVVPPSWDNHVKVDPVTGLVHCSISDEDLLFSPRNELLFSFDPSGSNVTATPTPVLGKAPFQYLYDSPYNAHTTYGFGVYNGAVVAAHVFRQELSDWAPYTTGGPIDGDRWTLVQALPYPSPVSTRVAIGEGGMLLNAGNSISCSGYTGWLQWNRPTTAPLWALEVEGDVAWALTNNGQVQSISMDDGSLLATIDVEPNGQFMAVNEEGIYQVHLGSGDAIIVTKNDLSGNFVYSTTTELGAYGTLNGLVVDDGGRAWTTYTKLDDDGAIGGILLGFNTGGALIDMYTYGASMNGIATNGQQLFITGRTNAETTGTYLIGVDMDLVTTTNELVPASTVTTWPNPTTNFLHISLPTGAERITMRDASGRTIRTWTNLGPGRSTLEVDGVATGLYVLNVQQKDRTTSRSVLIGQ